MRIILSAVMGPKAWRSTETKNRAKISRRWHVDHFAAALNQRKFNAG
jgi:hypothetical protein